MENYLTELNNVDDLTLPTDPDTGAELQYPANNRFADQLRSAVTLAIHNPETMYISVGTPGLGGWDDHNNAVDDYRNKMAQLWSAMRAATKHINLSQGAPTIRGGTRQVTDNIIINVYGDFGRLVNLNNSGGWDHANNQNLYTFGGAGVRPTKEAAALGNVIGTTHREGNSKTNNQYTMPDSCGNSCRIMRTNCWRALFLCTIW